MNHPDYKNKKVYAKSGNRVFFGTGEEITNDVVNQLIDIQDDILLAHRWRVGDLRLIDREPGGGNGLAAYLINSCDETQYRLVKYAG
ncbi:hypothetical protein ACFL3I_12240 [Pseudomonadota bacterium]